MRVHGTLKKWNDDRGFGFITLPQNREEIFVHISAFQGSGTRPCIGETISFEIRTGPDGRKRAEAVLRPGEAPRDHRRGSAGTGRKRALGVVFAIAGISVGSYLATRSHPHSPSRAGSTEAEIIAPQPAFHCDGRTHCSQMTSCAEAVYFLQNCPNTQLDGNNDGEPCEQQWC